MKGKILRLNLVVLFFMFAMMLASSSGISQVSKNSSVITVEAKSKKNTKKKSTTRKPKTITNYVTIKKNKKLHVGPSTAGIFPETKDWKSSNSKVATVSKKGDSEGFHKVTAKKKGKTTISCTVKETAGPWWIKGDVYKWVITVK
ncbi:Ig-like domain-containing protein [Anaerobutyricum hallii]|uniref:Ig-like domain-containing protein n=1 Tax=Anaerobutyricum hallii TaxID=39488 RepID=UPI003992A80B